MSTTSFPSPLRATRSWNEDILFLLDDDLCLQDVNENWDRFALANGESELSLSAIRGTSILSYTPEVLRPFYNNQYEFARGSREPVSFEYHCSSPEMIRVFRMEISGIATSLLVANHLLWEEPCEVRSPEFSVDAGRYLGANGILTMCSNCRRSKRADLENTWEWVPEFLQGQSFLISHGLCPHCVRRFYGH
jgi:hypothetical protein